MTELEKSIARREQMRNRSRDNHMRLQWELDLMCLSVSSCLTPLPSFVTLLTSQAIVQIRFGGFDNGTRRELVLPAGAIAYTKGLESFLRNHPRTAKLVDDALDSRLVCLCVLPTLPALPAVAEPLPVPNLTPAPVSPPPVHTPAPAAPADFHTPAPTDVPAEPVHPPITVLADPPSPSASCPLSFPYPCCYSGARD